MGNLDELNKAVQAYSKYQSDKIRHDSNVSNLLQKRVSNIWGLESKKTIFGKKIGHEGNTPEFFSLAF